VSAGEPPPPPPPPPSPPPTPTPTPVPKKIPVSGGVLQGNAIRRVQPTYPPIAKAAHASGAVQVQVTISEEGQVIEAAVISGHPLLRESALQAARQWTFRPTMLSGVPVKVQGILTFNFTLQ
jgi:protein TonB